MPTHPDKKSKPSAGALRAARRFLHPLAGDFLQEAECKELARIIDEEVPKPQEQLIQSNWTKESIKETA